MTTPTATRPRRRSEQNVSERIVETVAEAEGVAPTELDPCLYDVIDPDALNELFQQQEAGLTTDGIISFTYHGYTVVVSSDSTVEIDPDF